MPQGQPVAVPADGLTTRQRRNRPLIVVHTGAMKGKSTAAFGLALRGWTQGWSIGVFQFVKSAKWKVGEETAFKALGDLHAGVFGTDDRWRDAVVAAGNASGDLAWPLPLVSVVGTRTVRVWSDVTTAEPGAPMQPPRAASTAEMRINAGSFIVTVSRFESISGEAFGTAKTDFGKPWRGRRGSNPRPPA